MSPAEYDAMCKRQREMCPLAAAGDARNGADLLANLDADGYHQLPQAGFECLALKLEDKCAKLEQRLEASGDPTAFQPLFAIDMREATSQTYKQVLASFSGAALAPTATRPLTIGPSYPVGVVAGIVLNSAVEADYRRVAQQLSIGTPLVAGVRSGYPMEALLEMIEPTPPRFKSLLKRAAEAMQVRAARSLVFLQIFFSCSSPWTVAPLMLPFRSCVRLRQSALLSNSESSSSILSASA